MAMKAIPGTIRARLLY
ncbi:hypothetical protein SEEE2651_17821 [Salmonella enterica subsp. enterica serovar Enteritidis str. 76-2651]|nr:hypothetical protein SEEE2651_17821 [Salmonella enterica subsp. enterica serovar Enteritidis str. 76-2651]